MTYSSEVYQWVRQARMNMVAEARLNMTAET
jgi:hypothetical protein